MGRGDRELKSTKKRRVDDERDDDRRRERSRSDSAPREKRPTRRHSRSRSPVQNESGGGAAQDSLSIEETNKLRAQLGLAPLDVEDGPKVRDADSGVLTDKIIKEDGMEFRHRKAENWAEKKQAEEMRDKIEVAKKKREIYTKVLKSKGLADSDSDDDAANWVEKVRKQEEEKKKAAERAKMLDQMDEDFGVNTMIENEKAKKERNKAKQKRNVSRSAVTGNLIVGHGKEAFLSGHDQILVLEDKGVLDDSDEVLINPNLVDAERNKRNVELKKKKGAVQSCEDSLDEWGNPLNNGVLAKYDDDMDGMKRETFRLDDKGQVDFEQERQEEAIRRRLMMAGKTLVTLDDSNKYNRASEFYTQEEMVSFRKTKKSKDEKKMRKRKQKGGVLKADDLLPDEPANGTNLGSRNRHRRRDSEMEEGEAVDEDVKTAVKMETEEGELPEDSRGSKWKKATKGAVDLEKLKRLVEKEIGSEEDSDDEIMSSRDVDLADVVLDDDAHDELAMILDKARRLKQMDVKKDVGDPETVAKSVYERIEQEKPIKMEVDDGGNPVEVKTELPEGSVLIDSTHEYCRNIGDIPTYGLAGNRTDAIDVSELDTKRPNMDDDEEVEERKLGEWKKAKEEKERFARTARGGWQEASTSDAKLDSEDEEELQKAKDYKKESDSDEEENDSDPDSKHNVLGEEADTTKGVGAMLKLASQKGYLNDPNAKKSSGENLDHLKNQRFTQMETAKYDIEEKYTKKLEKMGTTGRGPTMDFSEKKEYNPEINIHYVDEKGRELEPKDAFRKLSWKFHGKCPGKKQIEKRARRMDQREMLKKMDSSDTPLGTLSKQLKKQERLQTPYLVLSGNSSHSNFKKE